MKIDFYFKKNITLKQRRNLKAFITSIFKSEGSPHYNLAFVFCGDRFLLNLNRQFLQHDYYTDIITFDLSESKAGLKAAEVYISVDRLRENAKQNRVSQKQELHRLIFHGVLHLCGYWDKTKNGKIIMTGKEDLYLKKYKKFQLFHESQFRSGTMPKPSVSRATVPK